MELRYSIFILLLFATSAYCEAAVFNKVLVDNSAAVCLDGSLGAYYVSEGTESDKIFLYF